MGVVFMREKEMQCKPLFIYMKSSITIPYFLIFHSYTILACLISQPVIFLDDNVKADQHQDQDECSHYSVLNNNMFIFK